MWAALFYASMHRARCAQGLAKVRGARFRNVSRRSRFHARQVRRNADVVRRTEPAVERYSNTADRPRDTVTFRERNENLSPFRDDDDDDALVKLAQPRRGPAAFDFDGVPDGRANAWLEDSLLKSAHGEKERLCLSLSFSLCVRG